MHPIVKFPAAHFLRRSPSRRPSFPSLRAWPACFIWLAWIAWLAPMGAVARPHTDFPIAAEEHTYVFGADGTYTFSYDTGAGEHQSFRLESRDANGRVSGRYGYIDPDGALRITQYQADSTGYRANMLIYRKVTSAPSQPLLVGPLPRRVSDAEPPVSARSSPDRVSSAPVGPVPFFPPDEPVLIIGPLPKPLQPPLQENIDPNEGFDFDVSQDVSLVSPALELKQDSLPVDIIRDVPQGPPPNAIPSSILEAFLQDNFHKIFRGSTSADVPNPVLNGSQQIISLNTLQEMGSDGLKLPFSQDSLDKISQDLLQGPEVILNMTSEVQTPNNFTQNMLRVNRTRSNSTSEEEKVPKTSYVKSPQTNITAIFSELPALNTTFDVFIKTVKESWSLNLTQESRNNSVVNETGKTTLPTPPINIRKKNNTITSQQQSRSDNQKGFLLSRINKKDVTKPDAEKASSLSVPINIPRPSLTYLPADRTKPPSYLTFVGQLPDRAPAVT